MSTIIFGSTVSLATSATPSIGGYILAFDVDGILKQKDSSGNISEVGGGPTSGISGTFSLSDVLSIGNDTNIYNIILGTSSLITSSNGNSLISLDKAGISNLISIRTNDGVDFSEISVNPTFSQIRHEIGSTFSSLLIQEGNFTAINGDPSNLSTFNISQDILQIDFNKSALLSGQIYIVEAGSTYDSGSINKAFLHLNSFSSTTNLGVKNSVIIGGEYLTASESDSVYVPQLVIQESKVIKGTTGSGTIQFSNGDVILSNSDFNSTIGLFSSTSTSPQLLTTNGILIVDSFTGSFSPDVPSVNTFISTRNSFLGPSVENSVVIGGIGLSAISSNTVYLGNNVNINGVYDLPNVDGLSGQVLKTNGSGVVTWQNESYQGTSSLSDILQTSNSTEIFDIITGTSTSIRSSNGGGSIFLDYLGSSSNILLSTDGGNLLTPYIEMSSSDIILNSSNGNIDINGFQSLIITGDNQGLKYAFDYSSSFVTYSLVSKNYVDAGTSSIWAVINTLTPTGRRDIFIGATSSTQSISTLSTDYIVNIEFTGQWSGGTNVGYITLPNASDYPAREIIYKITSTYSMPGTFFSFISQNLPYDQWTDWSQSEKLRCNSNESIHLISDGAYNWNIVGRYKKDTSYYGSFYDTTTQTNPSATGSNIMTFNSTDISDGVSIVNNSEITIDNEGVYNIQFSAQFDKTDTGVDEVEVWLRKNGANVPHSTTVLTLNGNNDRVVGAWNFFVTADTGDYFQLVWHSLDLDLRILTRATQSNPDRPEIPSIILTVNKVGDT
jgi:hypothetical protein